MGKGAAGGPNRTLAQVPCDTGLAGTRDVEAQLGRIS